MGQEVCEPAPVKLVVGMLSTDESVFGWAERAMEALWGPIDITSEVMEFSKSHYYEKEMGPGVRRKFVSFAELIEPGILAQIKHQSNDLEGQCAASKAGKALGVLRPVNLDPGYLAPSKLVLATTKNYSHRIYIGEGMYAEATLQYHGGRWASWPYTYPDYAGGSYDEFLTAVRRRLLEQKRSQK